MSGFVRLVIWVAFASAVAAATAIGHAAYEFSQPSPLYAPAAVSLGAGVYFALSVFGFLAVAIIDAINATKGGAE